MSSGKATAVSAPAPTRTRNSGLDPRLAPLTTESAARSAAGTRGKHGSRLASRSAEYTYRFPSACAETNRRLQWWDDDASFSFSFSAEEADRARSSSSFASSSARRVVSSGAHATAWHRAGHFTPGMSNFARAEWPTPPPPSVLNLRAPAGRSDFALDGACAMSARRETHTTSPLARPTRRSLCSARRARRCATHVTRVPGKETTRMGAGGEEALVWGFFAALKL